VNLLGGVIETQKGFIRQAVVQDVTGDTSVVKVFSKDKDKLPAKEGDFFIVDCNEFCFMSK